MSAPDVSNRTRAKLQPGLLRRPHAAIVQVERSVPRSARGPVGGYDSETKQRYRKQHWSMMRQYFREPQYATIAMLPSVAVMEPRVARGFGFTGPIFAIEKDAARARVIRRKHIDMHTITGHVVDGARIIAKMGVKVHVFNADLHETMPVAIDTFRELASVDCFAPQSFVSLTICRNRGILLRRPRDLQKGERLLNSLFARNPEAAADTEYYNEGDHERVARIVDAFGGTRRVKLIHCGSYKSVASESNPTTMLWLTLQHRN